MALNSIGVVYDDLNEKQKALEYYNQALPLIRAEGDHAHEAQILNSIGRIYSDWGEKQEALGYYDRSLSHFRAVGDRRSEAKALHNIAAVYNHLGEWQKALKYLNQALSLGRASDDLAQVTRTLESIGRIYTNLGEYQKALEYLNQTLSSARDSGDRRGEADSLTAIGGIYASLDEKRKALEYFDKALPLFRADNDPAGEAEALNDIGAAYIYLREQQKALKYFNQALSLFHSIRHRQGEAMTLGNIGMVYTYLGEHQKALEYLEQALLLYQAIGEIHGGAVTLNNIGLVFYLLGEKEKALEHFNGALLALLAVGYPDSEGKALSNLMLAWNGLGKPRLAIFYGKRTVNASQQIRANIQDLDKGLQKGFLASREHVYRTLAEILISQNRLQEAEQILDLLKLQEFSDFISGSGPADRPTAKADLTADEEGKSKQYDEISKRLFALNRQYDDLAKKRARTPDEEERMKKLGPEIEQAKQDFLQFLAQLQTDFSKPETKQEAAIEIKGIKQIVRDLGAGTVALYTLVTDDKYYVILTSPQMDRARQYAIKRDELEKKVKQFKEVLQNPHVDPRPAAQELYKILLAPIEKELQQAKAQTLMWSLDGALRYIPMSALYDGQQYMVEKYHNVVINPTSHSRLREQSGSNWRGLGMGTSKKYAGLNALRNVPDELDEIIREEAGKDERGVIPGQMMLNETFTEQGMFQALQRNYKVVHIASHFVLSSKDARQSYLLLGDGSRLTLSQIRDAPKVFDNVDLVALSACDTASGGEDADGREVDAFGIITQQKGAKAVLASLWPVEDKSTRDLMVNFYMRLRTTPQMTKAEALRQAQLALLRGEDQGANAKDNARRSGDRTEEATNIKDMQWEEESTQGPEFKKDPQAPYSHPYYWAPFILIGNWR
jgi:CHAT domain-containing protein/Tfp pilus assembly protein PilF